MNDHISILLERLVEAEDDGEVRSIAVELQAELSGGLDRLRNQLVRIPSLPRIARRWPSESQ